MWMSREDWRRSWKPWLRGTFLGFPFGALPAGGSEIPTFLSYLMEKRLSKTPGGVRQGRDRGGRRTRRRPTTRPRRACWRRCWRWACRPRPPPRSCSPPSSSTACSPGPLLFDTNPELVWGLIASLYIGNVMLLLLNLPLVGIWVKLLRIPRPWLYAGILVFATLGAYTLNNNVVDLVILWIIGLLGFGMRVLDVPVAPCVVGLILGPLAEQQFRRALAISQGDPTVFFTHPISAGAPGHRRGAGPGPDAPALAEPAEGSGWP